MTAMCGDDDWVRNVGVSANQSARSERSGWPTAEVKFVPCHRCASGPGVGIASQTDNGRRGPFAWDAGGFFFEGRVEDGCQDGIGVKERWREAARQRRLGKASEGRGLTAERERDDAVGAAEGVGLSGSAAVKESLWSQVQPYAHEPRRRSGVGKQRMASRRA